MRISELPKALEILFSARVSVFLWGPPGIGKSSVVRQVAQKLGIGFIDVRLSQFDPSDLRGIPFPDREKGRTKWLTPSWLPEEGRGILFFDELNLAPPLVQASAYQLILDRQLGDYKLPEGWFIVAAGNREEDRAYVWRLSTALSNRFVHIDVETSLEDWKMWAFKNQIDERVIAFLNFRPKLLLNVEPDSRSFPTPRSWEFVSRILKSAGNDENPILKDLIAGAVGKSAATEFFNFLKIWKSVPSARKIWESGKLPESADPVFWTSIATALSVVASEEIRKTIKDRKAFEKVVEKIYHFSKNFPQKEYSYLFLFDLNLQLEDAEKVALISSQAGKKIMSEFGKGFARLF